MTSSYNPGEAHSCIVLNSVNDSILENISFDNIHLTFGGGGTAEDAARRDIPQIFGEYFRLGPMPAYGLYARNVRGITLQNVRFQVATPDLRPALILDHVEDVISTASACKAMPSGISPALHRLEADILTATRVLTPSPTFLQLEGVSQRRYYRRRRRPLQSRCAGCVKNGATEKCRNLRNIS